MKLYIVNSIHDIANVSYNQNSNDLLVVNESELHAIDFSKITQVILLSELTWSVSGQNMLPEMHYGVSLLRKY